MAGKKKENKEMGNEIAQDEGQNEKYKWGDLEAQIMEKLDKAKETGIEEDLEIIQWTDEGERLIGRIEEIREVGTRFGTQATLCILETPAKRKVGLWLTTVLRSKFDRLGIDVGDVIGIEYKGKEKGYHDFIVVKM